MNALFHKNTNILSYALNTHGMMISVAQFSQRQRGGFLSLSRAEVSIRSFSTLLSDISSRGSRGACCYPSLLPSTVPFIGRLSSSDDESPRPHNDIVASKGKKERGRKRERKSWGEEREIAGKRGEREDRGDAACVRVRIYV